MNNASEIEVKATRGSGLLEGFLAGQRAKMAGRFIPDSARSGRILDIGCGSNPVFLKSIKMAEKYGIDPNLTDSPLATREIKLEKAAIDAEMLLFVNDFFDVVTMLAVFEHISQDKLIHVLTEIRRVLKPGGKFFMTTPAPWTDKLLRIMASLNLVSKEEIMEHKGAYSHKAVNRYLKAAGFQTKKIKNGYFQLFLNTWACAEK